MTDLQTALAKAEEFERLQSAATAGPWHPGREHNGDETSWFPFSSGHCIYPPSMAEAGLDYQPGGPIAMVSDAESDNTPFLIHARSTTLPAIVRELVAEVERLRGEQ